MTCGVIVVAGGRGERLGSKEPKAFVELAGRPLLAHVLERLSAAGTFDAFVVVAPATALDRARALVPPTLRAQVVPGGARRQDSVRQGLAGLPGGIEIAVVHDAARPLVPVDLIRRTRDAAARHGAAIAALPVSDTIQEVDDAGVIVRQVPRERLWRAQTPQAFRAKWLREAHADAMARGFEATDDAALVARMGHPVRVVPGSATNLKITTPEDLHLAEALLRSGC